MVFETILGEYPVGTTGRKIHQNKGRNAYLYGAIDSTGKRNDFYVSWLRNKKAEEEFLKKALMVEHNMLSRDYFDVLVILLLCIVIM